MENNNKNDILGFTKMILLLPVIVAIIILIINIINDRLNYAIYTGLITLVFISIIYISIRTINKKSPYFFDDKMAPLNYIVIPTVFFTLILMILSYITFDKTSYKIGDIKVKFPNENGYIYGTKDMNNKCYHAEYYYDSCSIKIKKIKNYNKRSPLENIRLYTKGSQKITEKVKLEDIYNSQFTEGKQLINGKEWHKNTTQVDNIKFTLYYIIIDEYIYQIEVANYNDNPTICTNKVDETFKNIKYSK